MQGVGWTKVSSKSFGFRWDVFPFGGRNRKYDSSVVTSFFVSEFLEFYNAKSLFELFGCSGNVVEVAISPRRNRFGKRFGFARFSDVEDGRLLAIRLDKILIEGRKIHVNLPRFRRTQGEVTGRQGFSISKGLEERKSTVSGAFRGMSCSYAEAVGKKGRGFVTKKENNVLLNFQSDQVIRSRFEKAYVGRVCIPGSAYNIQNYLEMEGVFAIKVTPLGGNCCLLEEKEEGFIGDLIKEGESWWKSWFSAIEKWEVGKVDCSRDAWFNIYGIPIHVWSSDFCVSLGERWGRFICIDENTTKGEAFDVARILVNILISLSIPECVSVYIDGELCNLFIREDSQSFYHSVEGNQKVLSSDGDSSESESDRLVVDFDSDCSGDSVGSEDRVDLHPESMGQKAVVSSATPHFRHSEVVAEVGSRLWAEGLSGVAPEGSNSLIDRSGVKSGSDDVSVGGVIICKDAVDSQACAEHHLEPRGRKDILLKRQKDLECGLGADPSVSCAHSCSEGSSDSVSCAKPEGHSGLGPDDGNMLLSRDSGTCIWNGGRSGLVPDVCNTLFRLLATHSREVGKSGEVPVFCNAHSGTSGGLQGSEDASVGVEVDLEHLQICNKKKVMCVPSSVEGHSGVDYGTGGFSVAKPFCFSNLNTHSGFIQGPEGASERGIVCNIGPACSGSVLKNSNTVFCLVLKHNSGNMYGG